jgi:hypothetical protein
MGFFDTIFRRGKAYSGSLNPGQACELTVGGEKYLLEEFDLDFDNGKRYTSLYATFAEPLSPDLEAWITDSGKRRDGVVKFFRNGELSEKGAIFHLAFYDAVCVRCRKDTQGDTPLTTLVLAARGIRLLDDEN